jgi:phosphotransferase system enzyme I (PtsP)
MVLSCDRGAACRGVQGLLTSTAGSVRKEIEALARKQGVVV